MKHETRVALWDAINAYAEEAARHNTSVRRQECVAKVEAVVRQVEAEATADVRREHTKEIRQLERDARSEIRDAVAEDRWSQREREEGW